MRRPPHTASTPTLEQQQRTAWERLSADNSTPIDWVAAANLLLTIRPKRSKPELLCANKAQRLFEERRGTENIVLKARQMGLSTWIAGRFLLRTLRYPGTTTLMVAHTRESAAVLFTMVSRMWLHLPEWLREEIGSRGRSNTGQMTFPGIDSEFRIASAGENNADRAKPALQRGGALAWRCGGNAGRTACGAGSRR